MEEPGRISISPETGEEITVENKLKSVAKYMRFEDSTSHRESLNFLNTRKNRNLETCSTRKGKER